MQGIARHAAYPTCTNVPLAAACLGRFWMASEASSDASSDANGEGFLPSGRVRLKLLACHLQDVSRCLQMSPVFHCINTDNEDRFQQVSPTFCRLRLYSVLLLSSDRTCASSGIHLLLNTNFKQSRLKSPQCSLEGLAR